MERPDGAPEERTRDGGLEPEVEAALASLASALQKRGMYPSGHPAVEPAVREARAALAAALAERGVLAVGVAPARLTVEGRASDPDHPRLSTLADRLHRHRLASVVFEAGLGPEELGAFVEAAAAEPDEEGAAFGGEDAAAWRHIRFQSIEYGRLGLAERRAGGEGRAGELWLGLARAALVREAVHDYGGEAAAGPSEAAEALDPGVLARALEDYSVEDAYADEVMAHLASLSRELRAAPAEEGAELRARASELIAQVEPAVLERILRRGGDPDRRRRLVRDAGHWLDPRAVVKLVEAAAGAEEREVSHWLLLFLHKMAQQATRGPSRVKAEAEASLRDQVAQLVGDWEAGGELPEAYAEGLETLARTERGRRAPRGGRRAGAEAWEGVEPERVLCMAVELELPGAAREATRGLLAAGRVEELLEILEAAPPESPVPEALWQEVLDPSVVRELLSRDEPDYESLDRLLERMGDAAAAPLLDVLADAESRALRRNLFSRVVALGSGAAPHVIRHLETDDRWFVKRNMLALLGELEAWPPKWSPAPHADHDHPAVRREALKLMLRVPELRDAALCELLEDRDARVLALGLAAAQEGAPPEAIPVLVHLAEDVTLRDELRAAAVRALAEVSRPAVLNCLLGLARGRQSWWTRLLRRPRLADTSPVVLEALAALRGSWSEHEEARRLLQRAAASDDEEVRAAARGEVDG